MKHWLIKSEPNAFSFDDLMNQPDRTAMWDGIRNYQARNLMRDEMKVGDAVLFYHSQVGEPGVVGLAEVASESYPDPSQFDPKSRYYDEKATQEEPRWFLVDIKGVRPLERKVTLAEIREEAALDAMSLVQRGNRLSVQAVTPAEYRHILKMAAD